MPQTERYIDFDPPASSAINRKRRASAGRLQYLLTDAQLRQWQFRRQHEDFMRGEGFYRWNWPVDTGRASDADLFEEWLITRWLTHLRSPEYRKSADYWFLRAEFENQP